MRLEQVTAEGDYTVSTWDDTAFRDHLWAELRDKATVAASAKSMTLADREHFPEQSHLDSGFGRFLHVADHPV